ncbi:MAG: hypothetical protein IT182_17775 [Acidobacteria bacterium]|nr:hypothetical protein [Acidobacteriota bacterium]
MDTTFVSLVTRCEQHIGGLIDMFPQATNRPPPRQRSVPRGDVRLSFATRTPDPGNKGGGSGGKP